MLAQTYHSLRFQQPILAIVFILTTLISVSGQFLANTENYYFSSTESFLPNITSPEEFLGYSVGEKHVTHDQLYFYLKNLAQESERIQFHSHGKSHEQRPLIALYISHPENLAQLENIRTAHLAQTNGESSKSTVDTTLPLIVWQGYSIHGNEASGSNAALLHAYRLAASTDTAIEDILRHTIIILYPSFNPDGLQRFASWVNRFKNQNLTSDPYDIEYHEVWPSGRTNHYWFDLNRDWLPVQQPESLAKITLFQQWRPHILTDHHEMGSQSTFFFQPGIPSRTNPLTPQINQDLTQSIAEFHGQALDQLGSLYYAKESFDDFYYGKGSTYPDIQGCIGILFEQGSSRGHLQKTDNGLLSFPFTIRNQLATSYSTLQAGRAHKNQLQAYQYDFFQGKKIDLSKGYLYGDQDPYKLQAFNKILEAHQINIYPVAEDVKIQNKKFLKNESYYVPMRQPQASLVQTIFETNTQFTDSLFYDVSSWTLPLAFNLTYDKVSQPALEHVGTKTSEQKRTSFETSPYAYLISWTDYLAPKILYQLLANGIRVKVAHSGFAYRKQRFSPGSLMIPLQNQNTLLIESILKSAHDKGEIECTALPTGTMDDHYLGSPSFSTLHLPTVGLVVGEGITASTAGEIWHLLDTRYQMPITKLESDRFSSINLEKYNTLILPGGRIPRFSKEKLLSWIQSGGVFIVLGSGGEFLLNQGIGNWKYKKPNSTPSIQIPYAQINAYHGARYTGGCIVESQIDPTHPLFYGYQQKTLPVFKNNNYVLEPDAKTYKNPMCYTQEVLLSGYLHPENKERMRGGKSVHVSSYGQGRIIYLVDNPNFRAFWYGTNKIFANALFFGSTIARSATNEE